MKIQDNASKAREILRHWDDIMWRSENHITMGEVADAICLAEKALGEPTREEILIEKVIWLIEDSYPDTNDWRHDTLVKNIKEDLVTRVDELNQMFGDEKYASF